MYDDRTSAQTAAVLLEMLRHFENFQDLSGYDKCQDLLLITDLVRSGEIFGDF